jgi:hypothetical protein
MLNKKDARPEEVNRTVVTSDILNGHFESGDCPSVSTEDGEKFIPESLLFSRFTRDPGPTAGEVNGTVTNLIPRQIRHVFSVDSKYTFREHSRRNLVGYESQAAEEVSFNGGLVQAKRQNLYFVVLCTRSETPIVADLTIL